MKTTLHFPFFPICQKISASDGQSGTLPSAFCVREGLTWPPSGDRFEDRDLWVPTLPTLLTGFTLLLNDVMFYVIYCMWLGSEPTETYHSLNFNNYGCIVIDIQPPATCHGCYFSAFFKKQCLPTDHLDAAKLIA